MKLILLLHLCFFQQLMAHWVAINLSSTNGVFLEVDLPAGATVDKVSHGGTLDESNRMIRWGPLDGRTVRQVGFEIDQAGANLSVRSQPADAVQSNQIDVPSDQDGNGLSDDFEQRWQVNLPGGDPDGDGFSNLIEQLIGLDPRSDSRELLSLQPQPGGGIELVLPEGINLSAIAVQRTADLDQAIWLSVPFLTREEAGQILITPQVPTSLKAFFRLVPKSGR